MAFDMSKVSEALSAAWVSRIGGATPDRMVLLQLLSEQAQDQAARSDDRQDAILARWDRKQADFTKMGVQPTSQRWMDAYTEVEKDLAVWRGNAQKTLSNSQKMGEEVSKR